MRLIFQLVLVIALPLTLGCVALMASYYFLVLSAISQWEDFSSEWIKLFEKQRLHNAVYANKLMAEQQYASFYTRSIFSVRELSLLGVQWIYNTQDTSLMVAAPAESFGCDNGPYKACNTEQYVCAYDPRCRIWYSQAMETEGMVFVEPYVFSYLSAVGMTVSIRINDEDGNFLSILSIDYTILPLIQKIFAPQDANSTGHTVFFHRINHTVFYHKNWNRFDGIASSLEDIEFMSNSTEPYPNQAADKMYFSAQISNSVGYAFSGNYNIIKMENIDPFFQSFTNRGQKYYSLIYPIEVSSLISPLGNARNNSIVVFVGRINLDISEILKGSGTLFFHLLFWIQAVLIFIILSLAIFHYAAVLFYLIDIPLCVLHAYLLKELKNSNLSKTNFKQKKTKFDFSENQDPTSEISDATIDIDMMQTRLSDAKMLTKRLDSDAFKTVPTTQQIKPPFTQSYAIEGFQAASQQHTLNDSQGILNSNNTLINLGFQTKQNLYSFTKSKEKLAFNQQIYLQSLIKAKDSSSTPQSHSQLFKPKNNDEKINPYVLKGQSNWSRPKKHKSSKNTSGYVRSIAEQFLEKKLPNQVELSDVPAMSVELRIIVEAFREFSAIIEFLQEGYENSGNNNNQSLEHLRVAQRMFKYVQNYKGLAVACFDIGNIYLDLEEYMIALNNYQESLMVTLMMHGIPSIESLAEGLKLSDSDRNHTEGSCSNLSPEFITQIIDRVFAIGISLKEIANQIQAEDQFEEKKILKSTSAVVNIMQKSMRYFQLCQDLLKRERQLPEIQRKKLQILIHLFTANLHSHLGQFDLYYQQFSLAEQQCKIFYQLAGNQQKQSDEELTFQIKVIENFILYIQGVSAIKQRKFQQGCEFLTQFYEQGQVHSFKAKALYYIRSVLEQFNLPTKELLQEQKRLSSNYQTYDIFVMIHTAQGSKQHLNGFLNYPEKIQAQQKGLLDLIDLQFKSKLHGIQMKTKSDFEEIQMRILSYITNTFMKLRDRLFIAGYSNTHRTTLFELSEIKDEVGQNQASFAARHFFEEQRNQYESVDTDRNINWEDSITWLTMKMNNTYKSQQIINPDRRNINHRKILILSFSFTDLNQHSKQRHLNLQSALSEVTKITQSLPTIPRFLNYMQISNSPTNLIKQINGDSPQNIQTLIRQTHSKSGYDATQIQKQSRDPPKNSIFSNQIKHLDEAIQLSSSLCDKSTTEAANVVVQEKKQEESNSKPTCLLNKFHILFFEQEIYAYFAKLRQKTIKTHYVFKSLFK